LLEEGAHEKSPKCLGGNLGDFGEFCKGLKQQKTAHPSVVGFKTVFVGTGNEDLFRRPLNI